MIEVAESKRKSRKSSHQNRTVLCQYSIVFRVGCAGGAVTRAAPEVGFSEMKVPW